MVAAVQHQLNLGALLTAAQKSDMIASTVFLADGGPVLMSIAPLSPEEETVRLARDPDLPVDYLVAVDLMTATELAELGANLDATNLAFSGPVEIDPRQLSISLQDASGAHLGALTWARQTPGRAAFLGNAGAIVGFFLLMGAFAVLLARKLVSDQVRAAAELSGAHEANRVKSEFISTMSHELRTPLNAIMGYAELIKEEVEDDAPAVTVAADADRVLGAARHLLRLINDVLDQAKIDAGKLQISMEPVEVPAVLEELEALMSPLAQANGNRLSITLEQGIELVVADRLRLQQCLINLTSNALKFTHSGSVDVRVRKLYDHASTRIAFEVQDTGIGMGKAELARLFKPFAQANKDAGAKFGGTGLGLSITRNLARAMGGDVTADSAPGKGALFCLHLPEPVQSHTRLPRLVHAA